MTNPEILLIGGTNSVDRMPSFHHTTILFRFTRLYTVIGEGDRLVISGGKDDIDAIVERIRQETDEGV